jgi:phytanoyl-CoA hydroxylase
VVKAKDLESYRENGYLLVENVLDAATLVKMRKVIADLVAKAAGVNTHNDIYDLEPTHTTENPRVRRIKTPHEVDPFFMEVVKQPGMTSILKALLGKDIRLHGSKLNVKAPKYGSPVEWHQDWAFYPHTNDDILAIGQDGQIHTGYPLLPSGRGAGGEGRRGGRAGPCRYRRGAAAGARSGAALVRPRRLARLSRCAGHVRLGPRRGLLAGCLGAHRGV